jgi:ABC-2 type transport system permease protein
MTGGIVDRLRSLDVSGAAVLAGHVAASVVRNAASAVLVLAVALGAAAGAALIATAITAASTNVSGWVPTVLGAVTGVLGIVLAADLLRR